MLKNVLMLAKQGFRVFPIKVGTKSNPHIREWQKRATSDAAQISHWWGLWRNDNIGIAPAPDFFVLDVDLDPGIESTLKKLKNLGLPDTFTVKTPSGGYHLYYKHPGGIIKASDTTWKKRFPSVHVRGDGAYVVGPHSYTIADSKGTHEGTYKIVKDLPYADLPKAIIDLLPFKSPPLHGSSSGGRASVPPLLTQTDLDAIPPAFELPEKIKCGERDSTIFAYICSLVAKGKTKKTIEKEVKKVFDARVEQPKNDIFPWSTVTGMIDRAIQEYGEASHEVAADKSKKAKLNPQLRDALDHCILVEAGSKVADLRRHASLPPLKLDEWKLSNQNKWITNKLRLPIAWLSHSKRKTVHAISYRPGKNRVYQDMHSVFYNTYVPPELKPVKGDGYGVMVDHIKQIFGKNADLFLNWLAFSVQYPDKRIKWAPILIGPEGVGKGWFLELLIKLLGDHNCYSIAPSALSDNQFNFNEWIGGTLLWIDEIDPKLNFMEKLKDIITAPKLSINEKYGKKQRRQIFANVIACSNHEDALKLSDKDRRWWVVKTQSEVMPDEYYDRLFDWLDTEGISNALWYLLQMDTTKFPWNSRAPMTSEKLDMIAVGKSEIERLIYDAHHFKSSFFRFDIVSSDTASVFARNSLGIDKLTWAERKSVGCALNQCCKPLPQTQYTVEIGGQKRRLRLLSAYNHTKWSKASQQEIVEEYKKACEATFS